MEIAETRTSVWEALAGRAPGRPPETSDPDLWRAVVDRLNPAKARPVLRQGIELVEHTSVRGERYVMLRSPGLRDVRYLRLTPDEVALAQRMDGSRTVAALVGDFAKISGRLAPDQVLRVVADLAANRMLAELPIDAFGPLKRARARHRPLPARIGSGLLAAARGQRMVLADPDRARRSVARLTYRGGGHALLCPTTAVAVRNVSARRDGATLAPSGTLALDRGALLANTTPHTSAISPLALTVEAVARSIANDGPARFGVAPSGADPASVHSGQVTVDGVVVPPTGAPVGCPVGADVDDARQQETPPIPTPPTTTAPPTTATATTTPGPRVSDDPQPQPKPPRPKPPPPPPGSDPTIGSLRASTSRIEQNGRTCPAGKTTSLISVVARDAEDGPDALTVWFTYRLHSDPSVTGQVAMRHERGESYLGTLGPFEVGSVPATGGRIEITAAVRDTAGNVTTSAPIHVVLGDCRERR